MKRWMGWLSLACLLLGLGLLYAGSLRPVQLTLDGQPLTVRSRALTAGGVLRGAGLTLRAEDRLTPPPQTFLGWQGQLRLERASWVQVWSEQGATSRGFWSVERRPGNLLLQAGVKLYPGDVLRWNGRMWDAGAPLPPAPSYFLQVTPAHRFVLVENGRAQTLAASGATLGAGLWGLGRPVTPGDWASLPLESALPAVSAVTVRRAVPVTILVGEKTVEALSAAGTVGEALAQAGVALQGLDYAVPAEDAPLPADGNIRVVRVREEIVLTQSSLPFESEYVPDPDLELDQRRVVEAGQYGVAVTRQRVRFEDGQEVSRQEEQTWTAAEAVTQKVGYGTKVVVRTVQTEAGTLEYWRAVTVYATSYSPCGLGNVTKCYYGTSLGLKVQRGVIGVTNKWYRWMAGQGVYVPGYGKAVIADIGAGIPGRYWIDLGFTDADLELWHQDVVLYFLTPVPDQIPYILP
ncbi:ubiquitin-like domain-containing protein [Levilinea saccharolytica]|nr:ubiquitin-like domain-containing protein [Levilinea saccharolytica]